MKDTFNLLLTLLFACIVLSSCQKEQELEDAESKMNIVFFEDDIPVRGMVKSNYNQDHCGQLRIVTAIQENENSSAELAITVLTNGAIANVTYKTIRSSESERYEAPNMEVGRYFTVQNFNYDQSTKNLYFDFEGTVYTDSTNSKQIRGKVNVASVKQTDCTSVIFEARSISEDFEFSTLSSNATRFNSGPTSPPDYELFRHHSFSTSGQYLSLQMAKDISELQGEKIDFKSDDEYYRVIYAEYYGPMIFGSNSYSSIQEYWKYYQTEGTIDIFQKYAGAKEDKIHQGSITMDILDEGTVYKKGVVIPFEASSL
ncbi:hypothetical protein [Sphingobacterium corticibacter]|uniref:Uncharacterized protein n=1 Tax=Sphingobacterium corticibacter TaxID=2171749 RepID=A0A2T8HH59_9SPHI|nr:hypothetical protein [Sphingobacterium corticibacter]PVH24745.1 hypothetical protein DC487_11505 [Sphingobacterium corticibacter]